MTIDATAHLFAALEAGSPALAYEFEGETMTFAELDARARSYATALASAGVGRGDRVAVFVETCLELIVALFGNYYLGAIHVAINTRYREAELHHILSDSQPAAILCDHAGAEVLEAALAGARLAREPVRVGIGEDVEGFPFATLLAAEPGPWTRPSDEAPSLMIYTSGTTGPSKGVVHSHASVVTNIRALTGLWAWSPRDRLVLALPLFHVHGLCIGVHGAAIHAMPVLLERRFDVAAVVERFADHPRGRGTVFMAVPTMYRTLVKHLEAQPAAAAKLARARLFTSGSAALSSTLWHTFVRLTGQRILERYGMSETLLTLSNPYVGQRVPGAVGQPVPGCDAAVVDEQGDEVAAGETGELLVHSNGIMKGYWKLPKQTAASFMIDRNGRRWFRTGDVASIDEQGNFHLVGRMSVDIIKSGGFKISAREIEELLAGHEAVAEVAVVGVSDETWGEAIVACVVRAPAGEDAREDASDASAEQLLAALVGHIRGVLADYKKPRGLYLCEALPRNALGKLQKHLLREAIAREGLSAAHE